MVHGNRGEHRNEQVEMMIRSFCGVVTVFCIIATSGLPGFARAVDATNPTTDKQMSEGIAQVRGGDFESAVITLDLAARSAAAELGREKDLAKIYLYMGMAYLALGQESLCQSKLLLAIKHDPKLAPSPDEFPIKLRRAFEDARKAAADSSRLERQTKAKSGKRGLIALGAGGAAALGLVFLIGPKTVERSNQAPTVSMTFSPEGKAIAGVTMVAFTATGADPEGETLRFNWGYGDGTTGQGPVVEHVYTTTGTREVVVTAIDGQGASAKASASLVVGDLTGDWEVSGPPVFSATLFRIKQSKDTASLTVLDQTGQSPYGYPSFVIHPRQIRMAFNYTSSTGTSTIHLDLNADNQLFTMEGCAARQYPPCGTPGAVSVKLIRR
jgi:hypothetical protein